MQNFVSPLESSLVDPQELANLVQRYGEPIQWLRGFEVSANTLEEARKRLKKRRGEAVLVLPRPGERVLLHIKSFYPPTAYRLLSGGIRLGEKVEAAVAREVYEETGLDLNPVRLLGLVEYGFQNGGESAPYVSYIFLMELSSAEPHVIDLKERISEFREVPWSELTQVAESLEQLPEEWRDWGRYRAIPHRLVAEATRDPTKLA